MAGKHIFVIATMGLFSGDGAGILARRLQKYGAQIEGGLHLKMPDSIADEKALKRSLERNKALVQAAEQKIDKAVRNLKYGKPPQEGIGFWYHMVGLFGQRLYFYRYGINLNARQTAHLNNGGSKSKAKLDFLNDEELSQAISTAVAM